MGQYDPDSLFGHGIRLSELEKNSLPKTIYEGLIKDAGVKINKLIDEIAELRKSMKALGGFSNEHAESIVENMNEIEQIKESLQIKPLEFNRVDYDGFPYIARMTGGVAKLDSGGEKTVNPSKNPSMVTEELNTSLTGTASTPPEPNMIRNITYLNGITSTDTESEDRLPGGTGNEPREDDSSKVDVKGITMGIIKEFNKGLLGESMDFLMMKRSELENLNHKPLYTTNDIRNTKNNILTIKPNDLWIKWKFVKSLLEAYGID